MGADAQSTMVQSEDTGAKVPGIKSCLFTSRFVLWTWASFESLCLPILIFKGGIIIVYGIQRAVERVK